MLEVNAATNNTIAQSTPGTGTSLVSLANAMQQGQLAAEDAALQEALAVLPLASPARGELSFLIQRQTQKQQAARADQRKRRLRRISLAVCLSAAFLWLALAPQNNRFFTAVDAFARVMTVSYGDASWTTRLYIVHNYTGDARARGLRSLLLTKAKKGQASASQVIGALLQAMAREAKAQGHGVKALWSHPELTGFWQLLDSKKLDKEPLRKAMRAATSHRVRYALARALLEQKELAWSDTLWLQRRGQAKATQALGLKAMLRLLKEHLDDTRLHVVSRFRDGLSLPSAQARSQVLHVLRLADSYDIRQREPQIIELLGIALRDKDAGVRALALDLATKRDEGGEHIITARRDVLRLMFEVLPEAPPSFARALLRVIERSPKLQWLASTYRLFGKDSDAAKKVSLLADLSLQEPFPSLKQWRVAMGLQKLFVASDAKVQGAMMDIVPSGKRFHPWASLWAPTLYHAMGAKDPKVTAAATKQFAAMLPELCEGFRDVFVFKLYKNPRARVAVRRAAVKLLWWRLRAVRRYQKRTKDRRARRQERRLLKLLRLARSADHPLVAALAQQLLRQR